MSTAEFIPTYDDVTTLDVVRRMHDWAMESASGADLEYFFGDLAATLHEVFETKLVAIWDHNHRNGCLVLQASAPAHPDIVASRAIAAETSSTGLAVARREIIFFDDILKQRGGRHFTNPALAHSLRLKTMLSVPVFTPNTGDVGLVINLCYGADIVPGLQKPDIKRLVSDLSTYVQYLVYRRDEKIMNDVRAVAAASKGILSLFDSLDGSLRELTRCGDFAVFRWDEEEGDLYREAPASLMLDAGGRATRWLRESSDFDEGFDSRMVSTCVRGKRPLALRFNVPAAGGGRAADVYCPYIAVPLHSSADEVIGVIKCRNPVAARGKTPSFSSFDLIALESFSRAVAPSVERFLRLREGGVLMRVVKDVSRTLGRAYKLDTSLQNTIETLVEVMHSQLGSIYLRREGTNTFVMRAATEPSKHLIERAEYEVGVGVTGVIADGKLLNFRSREELRAYPRRAGKYYEEVYGASGADSDTLLGVPIFSGDEVIGLWKVENVRRTEAHPDPYYTDEDEQAAQVISHILEYVIKNYGQEQARLRQFIQLAVTSTRIQRAADEEGAISAVMIALEEAGFAGALLSLYDAKTRTLSEVISSGSTWTKPDASRCHIEDYDIRAVVLRTGEEEFVRDSAADARCRNTPLDRPLLAQYVLPLRLGEELVGTLQIDMGDARRPKELEALTLRAFASHLAIAISRRRSIQQTMSLTENIMQSSRFIAAESLSAMAVHSLNHKLVEINKQLQSDLDRREVREKEFLYKTLSHWRAKLGELEEDLEKALNFVRAPADEQRSSRADLHQEVQAAMSTWINYIRNHKCQPRTDLRAERSVCKMPPEAFREIMAVLIVNSVQAHSRRIEITTYNEGQVKTSTGQVINEAFCLEFDDNGDGLATKQYETIFEPTFTTKSRNAGTGLGLFIARRLARDGLGELEVLEKEQKGARFRLTLPVAKERKRPGKGGE